MSRPPSPWPLLLAAILLAAPGARAVTPPPDIRLEVSPPDAEVGLVMTIDLTVSGEEGADCALLEVPEVDGARLRLAAGPSTQNMTMVVNGRRRSSITTSWQFELVPQRPGLLDLPPFRLECRGKEVATAPQRLPVAETRLVEEIVTLRVRPSTERLYVGQVVEVEVEASLRQDAWDLIPQRGRGLGMELLLPWLEGVPGLHPRPIPPPRCNAALMAVNGGTAQIPVCQSRDFGSGDQRFVYRASLPLLATEPGRVVLPPSRFSVRLVVETQERRDPLDVLQLFGRRSVVPTRVLVTEAVAQSVEVEVRPTPVEGRPPSYTNAVGRFVFDAQASPTRLKVGESCRLQLVLTGEGGAPSNLDQVQWPAFDALAEDFRIFGKDERELGERRILELEVSPKSEQVRAVPALAFSFFDPEREVYETLHVGPFPLEVEPGGEGGLASLASPQEILNDLETIREELPAPAEPEPPPWTPAAAAVVLLGLAEARRQVLRRRAAHPERAARRGARRELERALSRAADVAEVAAAFARFLALRLGGPPAGLTAEEAGARLSDRALAGELRATVAGWEAAYLGGASLPVERAREEARSLAAKVEAVT